MYCVEIHVEPHKNTYEWPSEHTHTFHTLVFIESGPEEFFNISKFQQL